MTVEHLSRISSKSLDAVPPATELVKDRRQAGILLSSA